LPKTKLSGAITSPSLNLCADLNHTYKQLYTNCHWSSSSLTIDLSSNHSTKITGPHQQVY